MLQVNHQQHQHEINVSEHTTSNVNKIHNKNYIESDPSKSITTSMREKGTYKYENIHIQAIGIEFSRRRERKNVRLTDCVGDDTYIHIIGHYNLSVRIIDLVLTPLMLWVLI